MAVIEQAHRDVVICVMCIVVSISLSAALPVVEPGQHPAASTLALPVESKNGTLPVENNNGSDGMPDATTAQFAQQSISEASLEPRMTEIIQADLQGLKKSGKDQKNSTAEMVRILVPVGLICVCLAGTVWFCFAKTTNAQHRKAMLTAADLKVQKTPDKTSAGLLAKLMTNKSAASQAALKQREAHRQKDEHRRRKQLKVQLPEGCETAHDQSHILIHDVAELYAEHPGEDLKERRGAAHGKAAQSCAVQPFMGPETRAALASLSSSLEEWEMDPEERAIMRAQKRAQPEAEREAEVRAAEQRQPGKAEIEYEDLASSPDMEI